MAKLGSMEWGERSDGILSPTERMQMLAGIVRAQLGETLSRLARQLGGYRRQRLRIDPQRIPVPASAVTRLADELASQHYSEPLRLHCLRTYFFGQLWAQFHGLGIDAETLYVASLLHDLGLTPGFHQQTACCGFAIVGARTARQVVAERQWPPERQRAVYEAISYHLNPYLSLAHHEPEAACLQRGAHLDVIGAGHHLLPDTAIAHIHGAYPRTGFREAILASLSDVEHARGSQASVLASFGFARLASRNPLDRRHGDHGPASE
ncbi:HD domain-containing protein [Halomonas pacifica]|uniref:HD domain-containing protein n=1 Tax=Bisbaumannia pacifica TaxID=77098 RepID=UPI0023586345|nr:HD domain-containing protein [Halomonas pacifica]MDC8804063.1 HD domain-containing protein [Halomonas pacifica]